MSSTRATEIALSFWTAIYRADFDEAAAWMTPDAVVDWPLSNERMLGAENWKQVNVHYPGRWHTKVRNVVAGGDTVVTTTEVFNGGIAVVAISFFTIEDERISRLVEYWPETYAAPGWRSRWVVPLDAVEEVAR